MQEKLGPRPRRRSPSTELGAVRSPNGCSTNSDPRPQYHGRGREHVERPGWRIIHSCPNGSGQAFSFALPRRVGQMGLPGCGVLCDQHLE